MDVSSIVNQVNSVAAIAIMAMVVAVVELVKKVFSKDWRGVAIIVAAGIVGCLSGVALGVNPIYATILGFSASGIYKLAQTVSNSTTIES